MGTITYQWWRDGVNTGATGSTYVLSQTDVGKAITVRAVYTDGQGTLETVSSAATSAVANINDAPTGSVTITGTATQGQTLTAGNTLADVDGMGTITYQWWRDGVNTGATGSTYVLGQADVGKAITVRAVYTDGQGTVETVSSAATAAVLNVNDAPTGSVSITGTATQGQTLTASDTLADVDGMGTITYQWWRDGMNTGATGSTYVLSQADVGKTITVRALYTDGQGTAETVSSTATSAVANINDAPTGSVTITGTTTQGQTLTAGNTLADVDGMGTVTYQWWRDGVNTGATGSTYVLGQADVGKAITVRAVYTDGQGTPEAVDSAATAAIANVNDAPTGSVLISGTATQGQTLTASDTLADIDGMGTITYQWWRDGVNTGATGSTYVLSQADVGKAITVRAVYTDGQGTAETVSSAATAAVLNVNDAPTGSVSISGTATQGQTLTASNTLADIDGMGTVTYQWWRDGVNTGATGSTYVLGQADVGKAITVRAVYTDGQGTAEAVSSAATAAVLNVNDTPTGTVSITGTATQGQTLTASDTIADADGLGAITYQWWRDGVDTGATGSTYVLSQADVGTTLTVRAVYTDGQGTQEAVSSVATATIANINDVPTGAVTIGGTLVQGNTLTASNTLADADGMGAITYHWWRDGVDTGATGNTYALTQADVGKTFTVRAVYTDGQGSTETVDSLATSAVANANDTPTGSVTISGTATQGQTLTAGNSLADADGLGTITYHWWRDGADTGATGGSYTLTQADVGKTITVVAVYTDGQGTVESVDSAATSAVLNINDAPTGTVTIAGTANQGQSLTASNTLADADGMGAVTYHWWRDGVDTGATGTSYGLTQDDVGKTITVSAVYTDGQGTPETVDSAATAVVTNANDAPTGSVTITGTPTQGQTLTAGDTLADADGLGTITYHWWRNGVDTGTTGVSYTLTQADVGKAITVVATYTDAEGTPESVTSAATSAVANLNDAPTGSVTISGTPTQGQTLTATNTLADLDGLGTITYQWLRDGVATGTTGDTYVLGQADVGTTITARAVYTDAQGTPKMVDSAASATIANLNDAPTGAVNIGGTPTQGQTLSASNTLADADGLGTIIYHWWRDGVDTGTTGGSYTLTQDDVGKTLTVRAIYTDGQGTQETVDSAATATIANLNDAPTGSVSISGTPTQGQTLTASNTLADLDGLGTITYQWWRNGADTGATGSTYVLSQADVGSTITVRAIYTDGQGTPESVSSAATSTVANVNDLPTGTVGVSGTPTQGQTLTATNTLADADGLGTITYQWWRNGVDTGATGSTYVLTQADVGKSLTVRAVYTDGQGTPETEDSTATSPIANLNDAPTGSVTISGIATQGQTLTASDTLADVDGMGTITYHWWRDGVDTGTTGTNYNLTQADVGKAITVRAVYTDGQGTPEAIDSLATANVANINDTPTGDVTVSGTPTQGQTLTASHTLSDADDLGTITYHWLRDGIDTGTTGSTYVLAQADVGATITARAIYTDGQGTPESVDSTATSAVANLNDAPTGTVTITGTPTETQTLTVTDTLADVDGMGSITYHWWRDGVDTGATGSSYTLSQADVGAVMSVRATYTDAQGTAESVDSAGTAPVADVNFPPVLAVNTGVTVNEGAQAGITSAILLTTDADHPAAQITYTLQGLPAHGRIELTTAPGTAVNSFTQAQVDAGLVRYVHDGSETTADTVVFIISDAAGASTTAATLNIAVLPVNDAPTVSGPGNWTLAFGQSLSLQGAGTWQMGDVDAGSQPLTATLQLQFGTLTGNAGDTAVSISGSGTSTVVLSGTLAQLNAFMSGQQGARLVYAGVAQHLGDNMTVTLSDGQPGGSATLQSSITQIVSNTDTGPELPNPPDVPAPAPSPVPAPAPAPVASTPVAPPAVAADPAARTPPPTPIAETASLVIPPGFDTGRATEHLSFKPNATSSANADGRDGDGGSLLNLLAGTGNINTALMTGLVPINVSVSPGDVSLGNSTLPMPLGSGNDSSKLLNMVSAETMQMSGTALSVGAVWWISRSATLLTSLLISTPVWRQLDPLPVFNSASDEEGGDRDGDGDSALPERDAMRRAEDLFAPAHPAEASEIS